MGFQRCKYLCFSLLFLFAGITSVNAHQQDAVSFKFKLKKGDRYYLPTVTEQTMSMDIMGMAMDMNTSITFGSEYYVEDLSSDQIATMSVTFKDLAFKMSMTGAPGAEQSLEYDSQKQTTPTDPAVKVFAAMVGKSYNMKLASNGHVEEVQGLKEIFSGVMSAAGAGGAMSFEGLLDENSIRQSAAGIFEIFPENPVRIGDTWTKNTAISAGGFLTFDLTDTYTLKARSDGMSTVEINGTIKAKPGGALPFASGEMDVNVNMNGIKKGTHVISEETGWMKEGTISQTITGNIEMVNPATNEIVSMPMSMIIKTSYTSEKK
ncbi:hypothetical protein AMJ80_08840 [bacterium SM23_31]|nr:MAG: hypothetical protein AMJ80_08840 [bacterium SM23_31]